MELPSSRRTPNDGGFSTRELVVLVAAAGCLWMLYTKVIRDPTKGLKLENVNKTRTTLRTFLQNYMSNPAFINQSARYNGENSQGNALLNSCMNGTTNPYCATLPCCIDNPYAPESATDPRPRYVGQPFVFFNPTVAQTVRVSGMDAYTNDDPNFSTKKVTANYDQDFKPCWPGTDVCPIEVVTSFFATCETGSRCNQAKEIVVAYEIRMSTGEPTTPGTKFDKGSPGPTIIPASGPFEPIANWITVVGAPAAPVAQ